MNKKILYFVTIYSIINSIVIIPYYIKCLLEGAHSFGTILFDLLICIIFILLLISNLFLIIFKEKLKAFLLFNIYFYLFQIIHIKINGFIFDFISGIELMPSIIIHDNLNLNFKYDLWNMVLTLYYRSDLEGFVFGISLVPVILFILYRKLLKQIF